MLFSGLVVNIKITKHFFILSLGVVFALLLASPASAECRAFPKLEFWGNMCHRVTLRGIKLGNYIQLSDKRMDIVRCLAEQAEMADLQNFETAAGGNAQENSSKFSSPVEKNEGYRTYVTIPRTLAVELRKQAARRSLIENRDVSVNDIIVRALRMKYAK